MNDLDAAHALLDRDVQWSGPNFTLEQRHERLQFYIALSQWNDAGRLYGYRAITRKTTGELIGICGFIPVLWSARQRALLSPAKDRFSALELEIGYALGTAHRGAGYATEALKALIEHGFADLGVGRILAGTGKDNPESIALLQRVGMRTFPNPEVGWPELIGVLENGSR